MRILIQADRSILILAIPSEDLLCSNLMAQVPLIITQSYDYKGALMLI